MFNIKFIIFLINNKFELSSSLWMSLTLDAKLEENYLVFRSKFLLIVFFNQIHIFRTLLKMTNES